MIGISLIYDPLHRFILLRRRVDDNDLGMDSRMLSLIISEIPRNIAASHKTCLFRGRIEPLRIIRIHPYSDVAKTARARPNSNRDIEPERVCEADWIVFRVSIEIDISAVEFERVFRDELWRAGL
jgi:hypothetical protein